jgi:hypothetical protein
MKIVRYVVFFAIIGILLFLLKNSSNSTLLHPNIWLIFTFFVAISFLSFQLVNMGTENKREKFVTFFMASVVLRLILSIIFLAVFIFQKIDNIQLFAINFIVLYLCALLFEIFENIRNLRQN